MHSQPVPATTTTPKPRPSGQNRPSLLRLHRGLPALMAVAVVLCWPGGAASAQGRTSVGTTVPSANMVMPVWDLPACPHSYVFWARPTLACTREQLAYINLAHRKEGIAPMVLPGWYVTLTIPQQLLVLTNLERQARGLPMFTGLSQSLDGMALVGAKRMKDPNGPSSVQWGSNWLMFAPSALYADFVWMYDDGPGSGNPACTRTVHWGCWGHRQNILGDYGQSPVMGAAAVSPNSQLSTTELFAPSAPGPVWHMPGHIGAAGPGSVLSAAAPQ